MSAAFHLPRSAANSATPSSTISAATSASTVYSRERTAILNRSQARPLVTAQEAKSTSLPLAKVMGAASARRAQTHPVTTTVTMSARISSQGATVAGAARLTSTPATAAAAARDSNTASSSVRANSSRTCHSSAFDSRTKPNALRSGRSTALKIAA